MRRTGPPMARRGARALRTSTDHCAGETAAPSKPGLTFAHGDEYRPRRATMSAATMPTQVEIRDIPPQTIAYVRHSGPYQGDPKLFGRLFGQLAQWAGPRGLLGPDTQFLSLYREDPAHTDEHGVMCGVVIPTTIEVEGTIGKTNIPGGLYAVGHFEIDPSDYGAAWNSMYRRWLPTSDYQPDARPALELYLNDPESHPEKKHIVEIAIPVKPR